MDLLDDYPSLLRRLHEAAASELALAQDQAVLLGRRSAEQRLASFILGLRDRLKRLGGSANYQFLVARARGEFTAYLDGDDYWLPGKIEAQLRFLAEHPSCPAVYGNARVVADDGTHLGTFNNSQSLLLDLDYLLRRGNFLNNSTMMYRTEHRSLLLDVEGGLLDYRVHLSLAGRGPLGYLDPGLTGFRVGSTGSAVLHATAFVLELYWQTLLAIPDSRDLRVAKASGMADFLRRVLFRALALRRPDLVRQWLPRVIAASPCGPVRTLWMTACNVVRTGAWESWSRIAGALHGRGSRVLYRR